MFKSVPGGPNLTDEHMVGVEGRLLWLEYKYDWPFFAAEKTKQLNLPSFNVTITS